VATSLPGTYSGSDFGLGVTKAVLRLAGGETLADAIADLTGLGRATVEKLAAKALEAVDDVSDTEFAAIEEADKAWAEDVLVRAYRTLADYSDLALARESLTGPHSLATWAFNAGLSRQDRTDLANASYDLRNYYQLISLSMAGVVSAWYRTDPKAAQAATVAALGAILEVVREMRVRLDTQYSTDAVEENASLPTIRARLLGRSREEMAKPPSYYPDIFDNSDLAAALRIVEVDDDRFFRFEGRGLYWDGQLYGEPFPLTPTTVGAGELVILLGNPGTGKSTLAKGLMLAALADGRDALYCRLEDFARECASSPEDSIGAAIDAHAQAVGHRLERSSRDQLVESWRGNGGRPLVILDGLDELATAQEYSHARQAAAGLAAEGHPVLITSRIAGYSSPWNSADRHFAVAPLGEESRSEFAEAWFTATEDEVARHRYLVATEKGGLDDVLGNPLTLGFVCMVAQYEEIPVSKAAIFRRFVDYFLRAPWRDVAMQRFDPAQVGQLKQDAENVAWAMALYGPPSNPAWADIAELDELQRVIQGQSPYSVYASGLLIPHGPVEPLGGTQQRIRWLHRALHENFVAHRLCALVRARDTQWWQYFLRAAIEPTWNGALVQMLTLLSEADDLAVVMRELESQMRQGDTPSGQLAWIFRDAARHIAGQEARSQASKVLVAYSRWGDAAMIDPTTALVAARRHLRAGGRDFDTELWRALYEYGTPEAEEFLIEANAAGCSDSELSDIVLWIEVDHSATDETQSLFGRLVERNTGIPWYLRPIVEPVREVLIADIEERLSRRDPGKRLSLIRAYLLWSAVVGDDLAQARELPSDSRLRLAVLLGRKHANRDHDLSEIRSMITEPLADSDAEIWGGPLASQGFRVVAESPDLLSIAPWLYKLDLGMDAVGATEMHLTSSSVDVAIALLDVSPHESWNHLEAILWSLEVLRRNPTEEAVIPFARFRAKLEAATEPLYKWMDASYVAQVSNAQRWDLLAGNLMRAPSHDAFWEARVLCGAADLATSSYAQGQVLPRKDVLEYYLEGLKRWLSAPLSDDLGYPSNLDENEVRFLVDEVLNLAAEAQPGLQMRLLWQLERVLQSSGFVYQYFDDVRFRPDSIAR